MPQGVVVTVLPGSAASCAAGCAASVGSSCAASSCLQRFAASKDQWRRNKDELWRARSRLYQRRSLRPNTHFAAFFIFRDLQEYQSKFPIFALFQCLRTIFISQSYFYLVKLQISKMSFFRPNINGIWSEFRKMIRSSKILMRVTRKVQYFLEMIYENFEKIHRILMQYVIFQ